MKDAQAQRLAARANNVAIKNVRTGGLSVVSRQASNFGAGAQANTADTFAVTVRIAHTNLTGKLITSIQPLHAHWGPATGTEASQTFDWKIKQAIEPTLTDQTKRIAIYYAGQSVMTIARRAAIVCDPVPITWPAGQIRYERTSITTTGGSGNTGRHQIALGGSTGFGTNSGEGSSAADIVMGATASSENTNQAYSSILMLGKTVDGTIARSLANIGDSTGAGTDDQTFGSNAGGWPSRSAASWPGSNVCIAGEKLQNAVDPNTFYTREKIVFWHTDVLDSYLINDVIQSRTVGQMQADVLAMAYSRMSIGQNYIKATCLPLTDSTNGWFDVAGQTVRANEANRLAINTWLRDTSATGFVAQANAQVSGIPNAGVARVIDPCSFYEVNASNVLTLNGGFIQSAQSAVLFSRTATSATTTVITDSGATYTVNALRGYVVHILSGTGAGQVRSIQQNTATTITTGLSWTTTPDATSVYRIYDGNTTDGTHPSTGGHTRITTGVKPLLDAMMVA